MAVKGENSVGVGRFDVVELNGMVAGGGEIAFVGRDAKAVDLRIWVRNRPGAYSRQRFPESDVSMPSVQICDRGILGAHANRIVWS